MLVNGFGCSVFSIKHLNINCTGLNAVERFCLRRFIICKNLDFQRPCIFLYIFVGQNCSFLHDSCSSMSDGRTFLQESREAAELWCPYLEGHTTTQQGKLLTPVTHPPLSIPKCKKNWSFILQFGISWGMFGISVRF